MYDIYMGKYLSIDIKGIYNIDKRYFYFAEYSQNLFLFISLSL